jgi:hypothetical protein
MADLTLYPNGAGSAQGWDAEGGDYTRIDETSQDGDTTRLYSPTANAIADFDLTDPTTEEGAINSVTVYIHTRGLDPVSNVVQLLVRVSSTNYLSADKTYNNTSYHDESNTWSTNPATSAAWTWAEIAALRAGMKRISGGGQAVTQLRVVVDYTPATLEQEGFRFYNDDGDEDASTALASQDTNVSVAEGVIKRLRMLINASGQPNPRKFILFHKKSTDGTYIKVPTSGTSEAFTIVASSHIGASGEATTARLTAPSGKSTSDFDAGRISDDENPSDEVTISADDYTEMEWALQANAAAVDGGVYQFRVYKYLETFDAELTTGGTASALGENGPNETAAKAFDDSASTKWLHFTGSATWLKYDLGSGVTKLVTKYALTSANDDDTRDPKNWELQGSNDNSAWTTVDTVTNETFASRGLRKEFVCDTPGTTAYRYWRLYINANNGNGSITQLAEIQLYQQSAPVALDTYTVTPEWTIGSGSTDVNDARNARITGKDTSNSNRSAKITGKDTANAARSAHITGTDTSNSNRSARITGKDTSNDNRGARITGVDTANSARSGHITGTDTANNARGARITGSDSANAARGGRITGTDTANAARGARIAGKDTSSDFRGGRITGAEGADASRGGRISGTDTANATRNAHITGKDTSFSTRSVRITGKDTSSDNRSARITGTSTANDARSARITGKETAQNNRSARITGTAQSVDTRSARVAGRDTASDSRSARITGKDTALAVRGGRISGRDTAVDSRGGRIAGKTTTSDTRSGKITGKDTATATRGGRINGVFEADSSRGARITGIHRKPYTDSDSPYTKKSPKYTNQVSPYSGW